MLLNQSSSVLFAIDNWKSLIKEDYEYSFVIVMALPWIIQFIIIFIYLFPDYKMFIKEFFPNEAKLCIDDCLFSPPKLLKYIYKKKLNFRLPLRILFKTFIMIVYLPVLSLLWMFAIMFGIPYLLLTIGGFLVCMFHSLLISTVLWLRLPYMMSFSSVIKYTEKLKRKMMIRAKHILHAMLCFSLLHVVFTNIPLLYIMTMLTVVTNNWGLINTANLIILVLNVIYQVSRFIYYLNKSPTFPDPPLSPPPFDRV